jgi:hypothetical protein
VPAQQIRVSPTRRQEHKRGPRAFLVIAMLLVLTVTVFDPFVLEVIHDLLDAHGIFWWKHSVIQEARHIGVERSQELPDPPMTAISVSAPRSRLPRR